MGARWIIADVSSLYTTIPHNLALIALQWFLDAHSNYDVELKQYLVEVTEYLLTNVLYV